MLVPPASLVEKAVSSWAKGTQQLTQAQAVSAHASTPLSFHLSIRPPSLHMFVHSSKSLSLPSLLSPLHTTPIMACQWLHFKGALRLNQSLLRPSTVSLSPSERALVARCPETENLDWLRTKSYRPRRPGVMIPSRRWVGHGAPWFGSCSLVLACFLQWPWGMQIRGGGLPCNFWEGLCGCVRLGPCWTPALVAEPQLGTAPQGLAAGPAPKKKPYKQGAVL